MGVDVMLPCVCTRLGVTEPLSLETGNLASVVCVGDTIPYLVVRTALEMSTLGCDSLLGAVLVLPPLDALGMDEEGTEGLAVLGAVLVLPPLAALGKDEEEGTEGLAVEAGPAAAGAAEGLALPGRFSEKEAMRPRTGRAGAGRLGVAAGALLLLLFVLGFGPVRMLLETELVRRGGACVKLGALLESVLPLTVVAAPLARRSVLAWSSRLVFSISE